MLEVNSIKYITLLCPGILLFSLNLQAEITVGPCEDLNDKYLESVVEIELINKCKNTVSNGVADAQFQYGLFLLRAHENYKNIERGLYWLEESAKNGHKLSQIGIAGLLSQKETGLNLNLVKSYAWFAVAGEKYGMARIANMMDKHQLTEGKALAKQYLEQYSSE
ncbi:MAG: hypothetical protein ABW080_17730 [Candidatus Thiodiazotropha sp.]